MIDPSGRVLGVVFGAAVDDADTGFVLTAKEVERQMDKLNSTDRVPTGACVDLVRNRIPAPRSATVGR